MVVVVDVAKGQVVDTLRNFGLPYRMAVTPNGKLDRKSLPTPDWSELAGDVAPRTAVESTVAAAFAEILQLPSVGVHDSFFELGGHSMASMKLVGRIREAFGVDVSIRDVFDAPSVAELAAVVARSAQQLQHLGRQLVGLRDHRVAGLLQDLRTRQVGGLHRVLKGLNRDLVDGPFGLKILDELAETGRTLNSGGLVDEAALPIAGTDTVGVSAGALPRTDNGKLVPVGDYTPELPVDPVLPESFLYWERNINGVMLGDGPAGRIAVAYLDDPEEAIRRVADEIRNDPTGYGYKWRFAALESESPEMFAARKVQAVRAMFSDAQGNLNENLWRKVVSPDRSVTAYNEAEDGTRSLIIDANVLKRLPKEQRPAYVSGQVYGVAPNADGIGAFMDRSWSWMGEQYARISREPIFLANYIAHRRQHITAPSSPESHHLLISL